MENENKRKDIGALWLKQSKAGVKFYSGIINVDGKAINIVCFKNQNKKEAKHPDFRILLSEPYGQGGGQSGGTNKPAPAPAKKPAPAPAPAAGSVPATPEGEDDIPF